MQKIIIKNFRQIEYAEIEIKKITLLIGEQASGKSTIAKLIYFFQRLELDFFGLRVYDGEARYNSLDELKSALIKWFKNFTDNNIKEKFDIAFYFSIENNFYININNENTKGVYIINLSENFIKYFEDGQKATIERRKSILFNIFDTNTLAKIDANLIEKDVSLKKTLKELSDYIGIYDDSKFFPAGRNISVSYPEQFKILFFSSLNAKKNEINYSTDIHLMKGFIEHCAFLKDFYSARGGSLDNVLGINEAISKEVKDYITEIQDYILKGKYRQNDNGETINNKNTKTNIQLFNASSGQQEAIRILQDLTYVLWEKDNVFRIIEEPEAHLYPKAQAKLLQLIAFAANLTDSTFILTTHSPYLLSIVNNLLYYHRVIKRNPKAKKALDKHFGTQKLNATENERIYLSPDEVSVYAIDTICKSVIDPETGLIGENFLDQITEQLNDDFDVILSHNIANHQIKK